MFAWNIAWRITRVVPRLYHEIKYADMMSDKISGFSH